MNGAAAGQDFDIAIVGGGASGVLTAIHALRLARTPARIVLVEPVASLAQGVAYATAHPEHVLNVPARGMSAFDDAPADFVDYLAEVGAGQETGAARADAAAAPVPGARFIERHRYGKYLHDRLDKARAASAASLEVVCGRAAALDEIDGGIELRLESGTPLRAKGVVLAIGNTPKPMPARGASALPPQASLNAWDFDRIKQIPVDAEICIIGSGLSMVDSVLSLAANGHLGTIHVLSRHALLPLPHAATAAAAFDTERLLDMGLRQRMRYLREQAGDAQRQGLPWQAVMERLRPHGQSLWQSLSIPDQRRFLRHVVRLWDVHRHRIPAPVHAQLEGMRACGRLRLHRGRLQTIAWEGERAHVRTLRSDGSAHPIDADRLINATGVEMRAWTMRNPLLADLLGKGHVQPGPHGIGIKVARDGSAVDADDRSLPWMQVMGSLRIGCLWESIAVPELRGQAEGAARAMLACLHD